MSWWIYLERGGESVEVERFQDGATQVMGGSTEAELNVTWNYSKATHAINFHFRKSLDGKRAKDVIPELERVVRTLGTRQHDDYWAPTPGNAGHAANILLTWAKQHPYAVFEVH